MKILETSKFGRTVKKLHKVEKSALDRAVKKIAKDFNIGVKKKGDLSDVWVYKYKANKIQYLLAYKLTDKDSLLLVAVGTHENFYNDLKRQS